MWQRCSSSERDPKLLSRVVFSILIIVEMFLPSVLNYSEHFSWVNLPLYP